MIERLLFQILDEGVREILGDSTALERFFTENHGLAPDEIEEILRIFREQPAKVVHQYPRKGGSFPCWAIVLGDERESQKVLGDFLGDILPGALGEMADPDLGAEVFGAMWTHSYRILTYCQIPDATRYYYEIAKWLISRALPFLKGLGLHGLGLQGQDLLPEERLMPDVIYLRQLVLTCQRPLRIIGEAVPRAYRVAASRGEEDGSGGHMTTPERSTEEP